jgi:hypothetical protein
VATNYWVGKQKYVAQLYQVTISSISSTQTVTATINSLVETYTATGSDATAAAAAVVAQLSATLTPEFSQFTFSSSGAVITATGPSDGRPVSITWGGTATLTGTSAAASAKSPHDASDGVNWSTGSAPGNGDTAVFENGSVDCLYNLSAFTSNTLAVVKRSSYGGQMGLPDTNPLGFPEYLPALFETAGTTLTVEDNGVMVRIKSTAGSATTLTVTGDGGGTLYSESVEVTGLPASSVVNVNGGTLALSPLTSQSSAVATLRGANATVRTGPSAVLTAASLYDTQSELAGNYTTLVVDGNSTVKVARAATAGTSTTIDGGTVNWASTGGPNTTSVNTGATLDFSGCPALVSVGTITLDAGATLNDPYERMTKTFNLVLNCKMSEVTMDLGTRINLAVS